MDEQDIVLAMKDMVRKALEDAAEDQIESAKLHLESELRKITDRAIANLINNIQIRMMTNPMGEYVIQINMRG